MDKTQAEDFVEKIVNGDVAGLKGVFDEMMLKPVFDKIEIERRAVGSSLFGDADG